MKILTKVPNYESPNSYKKNETNNFAIGLIVFAQLQLTFKIAKKVSHFTSSAIAEFSFDHAPIGADRKSEMQAIDWLFSIFQFLLFTNNRSGFKKR